MSAREERSEEQATDMLWQHRERMEELDRRRRRERRYLTVQAVEIEGIVGDLTRHQVTIDADGPLSRKALNKALRARFCL